MAKLKRNVLIATLAVGTAVTPLTILSPDAMAQTPPAVCYSQSSTEVTIRANLAYEFGIGFGDPSRDRAISKLSSVNNEVDRGVNQVVDSFVGTGAKVRYSVFSDTSTSPSSILGNLNASSWVKRTFETEFVTINTQADADRLKTLLNTTHKDAIRQSNNQNGSYGIVGRGIPYEQNRYPSGTVTIDFAKRGINNPTLPPGTSAGTTPQERQLKTTYNSARQAVRQSSTNYCTSYGGSTNWNVSAGKSATLNPTSHVAGSRYALASGPSWVKVNATTGALTATPPLDATGNHPVTVTLTYPNGQTTTLTKTVEITPAQAGQHSPSYPALSARVDSTSTFTLQNAPAGVRVEKISGPDWVTVDASGKITLSPKVGATSSPVSVRVTYADGSTDTVNATARVTSYAASLNPAYPSGTAVSMEINQTRTVSISGAQLPAGTTFAVTSSTAGSGATVGTDGKLTVKPTTPGAKSVLVTITYPDGTKDTARYDFTATAPAGVVDSDNDGVPDDVEKAEGTDPNDPRSFKDSDGDEVPDYVERQEGTNPNDPKSFKDSDGDEVPDYVERVESTRAGDKTNYLDSDGDGVPDYVERREGTDPNDPKSFKDSDGDGIPDYVERHNPAATPPSTDPSTPPAPEPEVDMTTDTDGDEVPDSVERQDGTDPNDRMSYKDSDGDEVPDFVETDKEKSNANDVTNYLDSDGDGVPDYVERRDGTDPNDPNSFKDSDGDGVPDYVERRDGTDPNDPNSFKDSDGDGVPDYVERRDGTDPNDPNSFKDSDGDGVPDYVERRDGTDPNDPNSFKDSDGDGVPDYVERRDGTDPNDPNSFKDENGNGVPDYTERTSADTLNPTLPGDGKVTVAPGETVTIDGPTANGEDLPAGTTLTLSPDTPAWVTVGEGGKITFAPDKDVAAGEYEYALVITYPDGSVDIVEGKVTVAADRTSSQEQTTTPAEKKQTGALANTGAQVWTLMLAAVTAVLAGAGLVRRKQ